MLQTSRGILSNPIQFLMHQTAHYPPVGFPKHSLKKNKNFDTKKKGPILHQAKDRPPNHSFVYTLIHNYRSNPVAHHSQPPGTHLPS